MHVKNIHCMIEELADGLKSNVTKNMKADEVKVLGETVDMLKDLCTAEYYARIAKAMEESEKEDEEEAKYMMKQMKEQYGEEDGERMYPMGYNRNRYSNGRFAPRGRGRRMGYMPSEMHMPYLEDEYMAEYLGYPYMDDVKMRMGYNSSGRGGNSGMGMRGGDMNNGNMGGNGGNQGRSGYGDGRGESEGSRYGRSYDSYRENRRHFTETKSEESKKHMENSMKQYTNDVMENIREMWRDADPTLRKSMKEDLTKMVQQLQ